MPQRTRSRTVANVRFQENLASASIHRLPNEVIARILVIGCPFPDHTCRSIDTRPLKHQVLVTAVCTLWRQIAHHSPSLWTSVVVRPPYPKKYLSLYQNLLSAVLTRSGTLELDISIAVPEKNSHASTYYHLLAPHLPRVHTLEVDILNPHANFIPISPIPELNKLRHFYSKGWLGQNPVVIPLAVQHSPLETFYYEMASPLRMSSVPTTELQTVRFRCLQTSIQPKEVVKFFENCKLQILEIDVWNWDPEQIISSPTLAHLDIRIGSFGRLSTSCVIGQLPNLRHLNLAVSAIWLSGNRVTWPPLPSLRSLTLRTDEARKPYFEHILQGTPQLVALQIYDTEALAAFDLWGKAGTEGGVRADSLRLVRVLIEFPLSAKRYDELSDLARILHGEPHIQTEWYTQGFTENRYPVLLDGIQATHLLKWKVEPSPPLFRRADEIIGEDGI